MCSGHFYFLTIVLLNLFLFIIWHWNCYYTSLSPFKMFLYVLPSSFYASDLFKRMLDETEIMSNLFDKMEVLDVTWYFK